MLWLYFFTKGDNPCESPSDILSECIDEQTNDILVDKLNKNENIIWYYDIETRSCRSISQQCVHQKNPNRFNSVDLCKTQCLPNLNDLQTQSRFRFLLKKQALFKKIFLSFYTVYCIKNHTNL